MHSIIRLTSWGEGASLAALVGYPIDFVTIKMLYVFLWHLFVVLSKSFLIDAGDSSENIWLLSVFGFLRSGLSSWEYRNRCSLDALCLLVVQGTTLGSNNQVACPSASKLVLEACRGYNRVSVFLLYVIKTYNTLSIFSDSSARDCLPAFWKYSVTFMYHLAV